MPVNGFLRTGTMRVWPVVDGLNAKKLFNTFAFNRGKGELSKLADIGRAQDDLLGQKVKQPSSNVKADAPLTANADKADPFGSAAPPLNRWLVTSSVAGVACTLVVGAAMFGSGSRETVQVSQPVHAQCRESMYRSIRRRKARRGKAPQQAFRI